MATRKTPARSTAKKRAPAKKKAPAAPKQPPVAMTRMTVILRDDQLRWLRRQAFEAKDRGDRGVDMSSIIRDMLDEKMARS